MKNSRLLRISIFYVLALLSNIFRKELFGLDSFRESLPEWLVIAISPLQSIGIFIGALIALQYKRKNNKLQYSFFGTSKLYSILIALIPLILVIVFGFKNNSGILPHFYAILPAISILAYSFFEEIGWRGYLQDELRNLKQWQRILVIGFFWWFWHLGFIGNPDIINNLTFLAILTAAAFGLGVLIEQTKSVLTVTAFHVVVNILFLNPSFKIGMPFKHRLLIAGISVVLWVLILILWERKHTKNKDEKSTMHNKL